MKRTVAIFIAACVVAVATFSMAEPGGGSPNSTTDLAAITAELHQTQTQLERAVDRISVLEEQVAALQKSNAELQRALRSLQAPHLATVQSNQVPQVPQAPQMPQAPQGLRVVPLQAR